MKLSKWDNVTEMLWCFLCPSKFAKKSHINRVPKGYILPVSYPVSENNSKHLFCHVPLNRTPSNVQTKKRLHVFKNSKGSIFLGQKLVLVKISYIRQCTVLQ